MEEQASPCRIPVVDDHAFIREGTRTALAAVDGLGVVLYEMLAGEVPYDAETPIGVAMKHVNEPLRPPKHSNGGIPEALDALTVRFLAKDPSDRPSDADAVVRELERLGRGDPLTAAPSAEGPTVPLERTVPPPTRPGGQDLMGRLRARQPTRRLAPPL